MAILNKYTSFAHIVDSNNEKVFHFAKGKINYKFTGDDLIPISGIGVK